MPYISREDGERFVIPSYRDTLSAAKPTLLKKEIQLLAGQYGEYITLQKKSNDQFEVAFSPDPGYLLGECVWHYFKRPVDMVYCESIPNTSEAILVVVKESSVYLDGTFPLDSIIDELIVFKTQKNNFQIFVDGNVPISQEPEEGKFSFDSDSVQSFTVLDKPVFTTLTGFKAFQLQQVDVALRQQKIGVLPVGKIFSAFLILMGMWFIYQYLSRPAPIRAIPIAMPIQLSPTASMTGYIDALKAPNAATEIRNLTQMIMMLYSIPGWMPTSLVYTPGLPATLETKVTSTGAKIQVLTDWATSRNVAWKLEKEGLHLTLTTLVPKRNEPKTINSLQYVLSNVVDRVSFIIPGNVVQLGAIKEHNNYSEQEFTVNLNGLVPTNLDLIGNVLSDLPVVVSSAKLSINSGYLSGSIQFKAYGN